MELYIIYYVALLLLFGYWVIFHNPAMNSISAFIPEQPSIDDPVEELDENSFYHHPAWTRRWSHPDFTEEAMRAWEKMPWYGHSGRLARDFLSDTMPSDFPWGYVIYRTVYTAESDKLWPLAMAKLTRFLNYEIEQDLRGRSECRGTDPRPEQLVQESHRDVVISDKQCWDGAGIEQVRQHFADYRRKTKIGVYGGSGRFEACIMIDERSLRSIIAAPDIEDRFRGAHACVGMVDGTYDPERKDNQEYSGFMRVKIRVLWWLYINLRSRPMEELCPSAPPGFIPVYDGGYGEVQDEEGNTHNIPQRPAHLSGRGRGFRDF
ncbi:hypothetical protein BDV30DRAFT_156276 [Aspergillus minisclerotigenes]|uniref:Uncharacterized protein n=1 Tax=Aspergillus minisclerotigenes TaxID=656917 RepID=A0A5N6JH16_9EURO|nr:hypothetical protein BDV30DRAFT_156276 [Aspergillus minisclerotigenes]